MTENQLARLREAGFDIDGALERFMNNDTMYEKYLRKFFDDKNYGLLVNAIAEGNKKDALSASHTLKGTSANLSFTGLYKICSAQVDAIRAGEWDDAVDMMKTVTDEYENVIRVLREIL